MSEMILILVAAGCIFASAALWQHAFTYKNDASPMGSVILVASVVIGLTGVFLFGVVAGKFL
jgi:hypothetical protein